MFLDRLLRAVVTVIAAGLLTLLLLEALPGDPLDRLSQPGIGAGQAERTRVALGLDRSAPARWAAIVRSYLRGELGYSWTRRRSVARAVREALPYSLVLGTLALGLAYALGLVVAWSGLLSGPRVRRVLLTALLPLALAPGFWLGLLGIALFHGWLGWLPASHAAPPGGAGRLPDWRHLLLPALTLALPAAAMVARYQLAAAAQALAAPGAAVARALGLGRARIAWNHGLRPTLGTTVVLVGLDLPLLVSGALVVETVFSWPGVGRLAAGAVLASDYPLALALVLLGASTVVLGNLGADLVAAALDPRRSGPDRVVE
ncbi:MAG: ABC transporter permease [Acidobacteriota bacterium]|nr:ABC transporter permease [Acidobacteriota bacterium]MDQ7087006.1 ABC transporter permease [Acidobacteriota bacterium]